MKTDLLKVGWRRSSVCIKQNSFTQLESIVDEFNDGLIMEVYDECHRQRLRIRDSASFDATFDFVSNP